MNLKLNLGYPNQFSVLLTFDYIIWVFMFHSDAFWSYQANNLVSFWKDHTLAPVKVNWASWCTELSLNLWRYNEISHTCQLWATLSLSLSSSWLLYIGWLKIRGAQHSDKYCFWTTEMFFVLIQTLLRSWRMFWMSFMVKEFFLNTIPSRYVLSFIYSCVHIFSSIDHNLSSQHWNFSIQSLVRETGNWLAIIRAEQSLEHWL